MVDKGIICNIIILLEGKIKPNFQSDMSYETERNKISPEKREWKSRSDDQVMPPNYNLAQSNYYTKMNDSTSQIKVKY